MVLLLEDANVRVYMCGTFDGGGSRKTIKYSRHIAANITELPDVLRGRRRLPNSSNSALRNHEAMSVSPIPSPVGTRIGYYDIKSGRCPIWPIESSATDPPSRPKIVNRTVLTINTKLHRKRAIAITGEVVLLVRRWRNEPPISVGVVHDAPREITTAG